MCRLPVLVRDIAGMSGGVALAARLNTPVVFLIPRPVSVEDFRYWRLSLLYAGYPALVHMRFADGALLRWGGRPLEEFCDEMGPSMKFLFWQEQAELF